MLCCTTTSTCTLKRPYLDTATCLQELLIREMIPRIQLEYKNVVHTIRPPAVSVSSQQE